MCTSPNARWLILYLNTEHRANKKSCTSWPLDMPEIASNCETACGTINIYLSIYLLLFKFLTDIMSAPPKVTIAEFISKKGKRSDVWSYFGFKKTDKIDKSIVVCKLCYREFSYKNNTTNMRQHLDRAHWRETHVRSVEITIKQYSPCQNPIKPVKLPI